MVDGEQYIIVPTGNAASAATCRGLTKYCSTRASRTSSRLLAFRLGGKAKYPAFAATAATVTRPQIAKMDRKLPKRGKILFEANGCAECHGMELDSSGGPVPDLRLPPPSSLATLKSVVQDGALAHAGMPRFAEMSNDDARAIFAYIVNGARDYYTESRKQ